MKLQGKVALVTGASRGIGRAIAVALANEGALVAVHGRNLEAAEETVKTIERSGGKALALGAELSVIAEIKQLFRSLDAELTKRTGAARFDILVNNASIAELGTIEETSEKLFDRHFAINVRAVCFLTKDALSHLNDGGPLLTSPPVEHVSRSPAIPPIT